MVLTVIFSLVLGVVQVLLQNFAFGMLLGKKYLHGGVLVFAKIVLYGAGIFVLLKFLRAFAVGAAVGFGVGFFLTLAVVTAVRISASHGKGD